MRVAAFFTIVVSVLALAAVASPSARPATGEPVELIVRFEPGTTAVERLDAREEAGTDLARTLPVPGMQLLEVEPGQSAAEAERALEGAGGVLYAEPNAERRAFLRPNDPYFRDLWAMENTGQAIRGTSGTPDADADVAEAWDARVGGGTVVAVLDTGVDDAHADLAPNRWRNAGESGAGRESNGRDDDLNGHVDDWRGWDWVSSDNNPSDANGHGTHVAGTIAADRGNGVGVAGIADGARIMPLRVLDGAGAGRVSDVILAYAYASRNGARVVNLSLGSASSSRSERDAIAAFQTMLFVAAAGNGGADGVGDDNDAAATYPCAYLLPNVLCVAASDNRDRLAGFSNYGATSVDLAAPGVAIASTWPGGGYSWSSGTSMATPHASGAAALLWAAAPDSRPTDVKASIMSGTDARPAFTGRTVTGGRLNVLRSLRMVADVGIGAPAPAPSPGGSGGGSGQGGGSGSSGGVGDAVPPRLSVRPVRGQRLARIVRRGLRVRVRCSERCTVRLVLRRSGRRLSRPLATTLGARGSRIVRLRLTRAGRRVLRARRMAGLRLVARATDRARNTRRLTVRMRVSR